MDVDVIYSWPDNMDYPLCREFIEAHADAFNKVFIVFTKSNRGHDYKGFVRQALGHISNVVMVDSPEVKGGEDWRNVAVNHALDLSKSRWVWFVEQDLFVTSIRFWQTVNSAKIGYDVLGYKDGETRLHPSNLWVKRAWINKTRRDFGIVAGKLDHFALFYEDLLKAGAKIKQLNYNQKTGNFYHMNGLSSNLSLVQSGEKPNYRVEEFNEYLRMTLECVFLDERYIEMVKGYLAKCEDRKGADDERLV